MLGKLLKFFLGHPDGMTSVGNTPDDFTLGNIKNLDEVLKETKDGDNIYIAYNQYKNRYTNSACTLFSPACVVSSLYNITLTDKQVDAMWAYAKKNAGYVAMRGNTVKLGVETFCKRWNENFPDKAVVYFLTDISSVKAKEIRDKGHLLACSYAGNKDRNIDKADRNVQGVEFPIREYGHALPLGANDYFYDSNVPDFDSVYKIYPGNLQKLIDNGVVMSEAYAILPTNTNKLNLKLNYNFISRKLD